MLGWAIGFFIAALVAAVFGFGGIATAFTGIAIILFWVFLALFVLSLVFNTFGGAHAVGHGASGRTAARVALIGGVALLVYAWVDNDMSAERVGASIDRTGVQLAEGASDAISEGADRASTLVADATTEIRNDASDGLDEASGNVEPKRNNSKIFPVPLSGPSLARAVLLARAHVAPRLEQPHAELIEAFWIPRRPRPKRLAGKDGGANKPAA